MPDREPATATAWLVGHQEITVVARDRGGEYGEAVTRALPQATQVADRWHLMENASRSFLDAVRKSMRQTERPLGRRRSIPSCSLRPSAFNMKPFSGGKRSTPRSLPWRRTRCRSKRSCVVSAIAGNLFAGSFGESGRISSELGRARWNGTPLGSMHDGHRDAATAQTSGGGSKDKDFEALSGWSLNGRPGGDAQREPMPKTCNASPRHSPLRA